MNSLNQNYKHFDIQISKNTFFFTLSNISYSNVKDNTVIDNLYFFNNEFSSNTDVILNSLEILKIDELNIFIITSNDYPLTQQQYSEDFIRERTTLKVFFINIESLTDLFSHDSFNEFNLRSLFIVNPNIVWAEIVIALKGSKFKINVSGGSKQKSHVLSRLDNRLNSYLLAMVGLNYPILNAFNGFDSVDKDRYLPLFDFTNKKQVRMTRDGILKTRFLEDNQGNQSTLPDDNILTEDDNKEFNTVNNTLSNKDKLTSKIFKREFHVSSKKYDYIDNDKKGFVFTYLDDIENMLKDKTMNDYDIQQTIETSWIELMKSKLEDPNISAWGRLPLVIKNTIHKLDKHNEKGIINKRFNYLNLDIMLFKAEIVLLSISFILSLYSKISLTNIEIKLGESISFFLYRKLNQGEDYTSWKHIHRLNKTKDLLKLGHYFVSLFLQEPAAIFEEDVKDDSYTTNSEKILRVSDNYVESIKDNLIVHPNTIPMVCKPSTWSEDSFGGFLGNNYEKNDLVVGSFQHQHNLASRENLYNAINEINSIKFSINTELLDYLNNEGKYILDEYISKENENNVLNAFITLKMADIYSKSHFYLNVNCDWRGRIYTNSFFLSYQGSELAKSMIQFYDGEVLTETGLRNLKICGTSYFSSKLNKSSINYRLNWVKQNMDNIISIDRDLINTASDKIHFTSFCLLMRKISLDRNCIVRTPVFLDATCSGLQHLSAMLKDSQLGALVNLVYKTNDDEVSDIYKELVDPTNEAINSYGKDKTKNFKKLSSIKLDRSILKHSIMTQVYNVTINGIYRQLIKKFEKVIIKNNKNPNSKGVTKYLVPNNKGKLTTLEYIDVYKMAEIIKNISLDVYPSLRKIYNYFLNTTKLLVYLNLPVVWFTPTGLKVTQRYMKADKQKVSLSTFGKSRTAVIKNYTNLTNKGKQIQSIIPNIIHSLDASHLVSVINKCTNTNLLPVITIHDCFGTHPNKISYLSDVVRNQFVVIYTQYDFLKKYHERVLETIQDNKYIITEKDNKKYVLANKLYEIPELPSKGDLDIKGVKNAIYMIN